MRLVDFLIRLLEAHAQTLQRLAALFGEEILLEILEASGDDEPRAAGPLAIQSSWFRTESHPNSARTPYAALEGAVRELGLPPVLQFHLWAYPIYRLFIESGLELDAQIENPSPLIETSLEGAKLWLSGLPITAEFRNQAERAAEVPWIRFRTTVLKEMGRRPIGVV